MEQIARTVSKLTPVASVAFGAVQRSGFAKEDESYDSSGNVMYNAIMTVLTLVALYFAFKCRTPVGGTDFMQVLLAICCAPFYIAYRLAVPCK